MATTARMTGVFADRCHLLASIALVALLLIPAKAVADEHQHDAAPEVIRLAIDLDALINSAVAEMAGIHRPERLTSVSMAKDQTVALLPQRYEVDPTLEVQTVSGALDDGGWFLISEGEGVSHGAFWTADGAWEIHGDGEQDALGHMLVDARRVVVEAKCSGGIIPEPQDAPLALTAQPKNANIAADTPDSVRVLIVYDAVAAIETRNIRSFAVSAINSANQAYINSNVNPLQLTLAGIERIDTPSTTNAGLLLRQLTNRYDNTFDEVHALRDAYDADLVAFLVDISGFCGIAWLAPTNPMLGFSITDTDCAIGNLTFAHELGHNFGCAHDPNNANGSHTSYGYGHHWNSDQFRSVMAYSPGARVPFFSNPDVMYAGGATGIANQRDNARLLDLTDQLVANMRTGDGSGPDCDLNGTPDEIDLARDPSLDRDQDGQLDRCQIADGTANDCDGDGVIDTEQLRPRFKTTLGPAGPFGTGAPLNLTSGPLPAPARTSTMTITVGGIGDLSSNGEYVTLNFNDGTLVFNAFVSGNDCYTPGLQDVHSFRRGVSFTSIANAGIDLTITSTADVDPSLCSYSALTVTIEYDIDESALDADGDGILTICELNCLADCSGDGEVDFDDAATMLSQIGRSGSGWPADLNNDQQVDLLDLSVFQVLAHAGCQ